MIVKSRTDLTFIIGNNDVSKLDLLNLPKLFKGTYKIKVRAQFYTVNFGVFFNAWFELAEEGLKHFQIPTVRSCSEHNKTIEELKSKNGLIQKRSFFCRKIQKTDTTLSIVSVAIEWLRRQDLNAATSGLWARRATRLLYSAMCALVDRSIYLATLDWNQ